MMCFKLLFFIAFQIMHVHKEPLVLPPPHVPQDTSVSLTTCKYTQKLKMDDLQKPVSLFHLLIFLFSAPHVVSFSFSALNSSQHIYFLLLTLRRKKKNGGQSLQSL